MHLKVRRLAVALALLFLAAPGFTFAGGQKSPTKAATGNTDAGKQLFAGLGCAGCHGAAAMGGSGPQIAPPPLALPEFLKFVRQPNGAMTSFSTEQVSDAQLRDIYSFLQSLSAAPNVDASSSAAAPAGDASNGKKLFSTDGCYHCHGYAAQGASATGPRLAPHPLAYAAFMAQLRHPRNEMPPYTSKVLSDAEVADIYAFLQTLPEPPPAGSIPLLN